MKKMSTLEIIFCYKLLEGHTQGIAWNKAREQVGLKPTTTDSAYSCGARAANKQQCKRFTKRLLELKHGKPDEVAAQARMVIEELDMICQIDPRDFFDETLDDGGKIKSLKLNSLASIEKKSRAIQSVKITERKLLDDVVDVTTEIRFHDKMKALDLLGKHHKLYSDMVIHGGAVAAGIQIYLPDNGKNKPVSE